MIISEINPDLPSGTIRTKQKYPCRPSETKSNSIKSIICLSWFVFTLTHVDTFLCFKRRCSVMNRLHPWTWSTQGKDWRFRVLRLTWSVWGAAGSVWPSPCYLSKKVSSLQRSHTCDSLPCESFTYDSVMIPWSRESSALRLSAILGILLFVFERRLFSEESRYLKHSQKVTGKR